MLVNSYRNGGMGMLKTCVVAFAFLVAHSAGALAVGMDGQADRGVYFSIFGGPSFAQDVKGYETPTNLGYTARMKTPGYLVGGAIGIRLSDNIRTEAEIAYRRYSVDEVEFNGRAPNKINGYADAISFIGNAWYDIPLDSRLTPYAGGGLGFGYATYSNRGSGYKDSDTGFMFQLGTGIKWAMTEKMSLDIGYRFRGLLNLKFHDNGLTDKRNDYYGHNVIVGITFGF